MAGRRLPADGLLGPAVRALVPAAVLNANGEVLDDDMELWGRARQRRRRPALIGNLSDDRGDWSAHRTFRNGQPCLDLRKQLR